MKPQSKTQRLLSKQTSGYGIQNGGKLHRALTFGDNFHPREWKTRCAWHFGGPHTLYEALREIPEQASFCFKCFPEKKESPNIGLLIQFRLRQHLIRVTALQVGIKFWFLAELASGILILSCWVPPVMKSSGNSRRHHSAIVSKLIWWADGAMRSEILSHYHIYVGVTWATEFWNGDPTGAILAQVGP